MKTGVELKIRQLLMLRFIIVSVQNKVQICVSLLVIRFSPKLLLSIRTGILFLWQNILISSARSAVLS